MKRWWLALVVALGFPAGFVSAYYVEITVDLTKQDKVKGGGKQGGGGQGEGIRGGSVRPMGGAVNPMGGMNGGERPRPTDPRFLAKVVLEARQVTINYIGKSPYYVVQHKWGHTIVVPNTELIPKFDVEKGDTIAKKFEGKRRELLKEAKGDKDKILELAEWVLKHGLVAEFPKIMTELAKVAPQDPAVVAYQKVSAAMKTRLAGDEPSATWLKNLLKYEGRVSAEGHYSLYTNNTDKEEVDRHLQRLEDTYHSFFFWFALKGLVLQVPRYRLVAVLITEPSEYRDKYQIFKSAGQEKPPDSFTARRDNVAVFCSKPLNDKYGQLDKMNQAVLSNRDRKKLLKGTSTLPSLEEANKQVLALVQKVMDLESERTTVTHEATQQLLAATALPAEAGSSVPVPLLARNLLGPHWLRFGLASFFETSRGAYWSGIALPSWDYLIQFKFADEDKKLDNIGQVLENVITDQYFREARATNDPEKLKFAHTMSWALAYYLANERLDRLMGYSRNLSLLPRDMEFDRNTLKTVFVQSFLGNPAELQKFATDWRFYLRRKVTFEAPNPWPEAKKARTAYQAALKAFEEGNKKEGGENGGMRPPFGGVRPPAANPVRPPNG